jgi:hypothetical protein
MKRNPMNILHVAFNPYVNGSLQRICDEKQVFGYELVRLVPVHAYEIIAVFHIKGLGAGVLQNENISNSLGSS